MGKRGPKPGAKNAGRPPVELDEKMFIKYCQRGCTLDETCIIENNSGETAELLNG